MKKYLALLAFFASIAFAQTAVIPSGEGTSASPYQIESLANLQWVSENSASWDKIFEQTSDIDASETASWNNGNGFSPIGHASLLFSGDYHGKGYVIRGLTIHRPTDYYVGFFGCINGAIIDSVGLLDVSVVGIGNVGGLVGMTFNSSTVRNSYSTGIVTGSDDRVGGLVGMNYKSTVSNSYSTARVNGSGSAGNIGGLAGGNDGSSISHSYSTGNVFGSNVNVGGLVGINRSSTISNSYSTGNVLGANGIVGGLVGFNYSVSISNSYSTGNVSGTGDFIGGLLGYNSGKVSYSYSTGRVSGSGAYQGGLIGYNSNNSLVSSCHWNKETSGKSTGIFLDNNGQTVKGWSTLEMKQAATFVGWDMTDMWMVRPDSTYLGLRGLNNAPFAFADTLDSKKVVSLSRLLYNDFDVDSKKPLVLHVDSLNVGTTDSSAVAQFPAGATIGDTLRIVYRAGEVGAKGDTLWGNTANACIVLVDFSFDLATDSVKTYGTAPFELHASYKDKNGVTLGLLNFESSNLTVASIVGSEITLKGVGSTTLYAITSTGDSIIQNMRITPEALTVTATAATKAYGANNPILAYTTSGLKNGDALTGSLVRAAGEDVGAYAISKGTIANANYTIHFIGADFTITKATLTVTADDNTSTYGSTDKALTVSYDGFVNSEDPDVLHGNLLVKRGVGNDAGTYEITASGQSSTNYTITYKPGTYTITPTAITVTAIDLFTTTAEPVGLPYSITSGNLFNSDVLMGKLTVDSWAVGDHEILQGTLSAGKNYTITYKSGTLTVETTTALVENGKKGPVVHWTHAISKQKGVVKLFSVQGHVVWSSALPVSQEHVLQQIQTHGGLGVLCVGTARWMLKARK